MKLDRWLWRLQVALIASAPILLIVALAAFVFVDAEVVYEHTYEDGTTVKTREIRDPLDRWFDVIVLSITALWQVGMGAAIFCLRRIAHMMATERSEE